MLYNYDERGELIIKGLQLWKWLNYNQHAGMGLEDV